VAGEQDQETMRFRALIKKITNDEWERDAIHARNDPPPPGKMRLN
jgi:hypothetical protein